jgi:hypothetical protein
MHSLLEMCVVFFKEHAWLSREDSGYRWISARPGGFSRGFLSRFGSHLSADERRQREEFGFETAPELLAASGLSQGEPEDDEGDGGDVAECEQDGENIEEHLRSPGVRLVGVQSRPRRKTKTPATASTVPTKVAVM